MNAEKIKEADEENSIREMSVDDIVKATQELLSLSSPVSPPHVIGKASVETYNKVLSSEDRSKARLAYAEGQVFVVETTSIWHERAVAEARRQVDNAIGQSNGLVSNGSATFDSPGRTSMEPDGSWNKRPRLGPTSPITGLTSSLAQTNLVLVLEVGYSQSMNELHTKAQRWLTETTAREVILISISANLQVLRGEIWRKGRQANPVEQVDFSAAAAPGTHALHVSLVNLFSRPQDIPDDLRRRFPTNEISIDLYYVKMKIVI